ncbi:MAG: type II secretion system secretin GspD [Pseudomonadota bacterium]
MNTNRHSKFARALAIFAALSVVGPAFSADENLTEGPDGNFTLNLPNADISSLITLVSRKTGKNFIVDPRVKAKVTVISSTPTNAEELYEVFLSVLQVHGFAAVEAGDLVKILPEVTARTGPLPNLSRDSNTDSDQLVTHVIKLDNVSAAQLVPILRPLVPQQGHLAASPNTNQLVITDRASNVARLVQIIRRIDVADTGSVEVIKLSHASASELIRIINTLESQNQVPGDVGGSLKLAADDRTNSLLINGDQSARLRVRGLVAHLDTPLETGGGTKVVYLKYAKAEDLVSILTGVSQGQSKIGIADGENGEGQTAAVQQPITDGQVLQQQQQQQLVANVTGGAIQVSTESNVDIQADPQTNALIITAPPGEMRNILSVVRQLDIRRAQVLVEAIIAEVSENTVRELGGNLVIDGTPKGLPAVATNLGNFSTEAANLAAIAAGTGTNLGAGFSALFGGEGDRGSIGYLLRAIASDSENNILSTPSLVTLDNEEASIIVGSNVPIITSTQLSSSNNNPFQTIDREDIGVKLTIKPQINEGDTIKLDIEQEVSQIEDDSTTGASDIVTSKRTIVTSVLVDDGQTLVLGGLLSDTVNDSKERVPGLSSIPILGNLFRYKSRTQRKRNLMVFLHPTILRDSRTASYYSSEKYNYLRTKQLIPEDTTRGGRAIERDTLPEFDVYFRGKPIGDIAMRGAEILRQQDKATSITQ